MINLNPDQARVIETLTCIDRILVIWPTGAGKSLLFQYWSWINPQSKILVFSPLIALMDDQVRRARQLGLNAWAWHSLSPPTTADQLTKIFSQKQGFILFCTPEKWRLNPRLRESIGNVDLLVIDEIHLVTQWGWDFRPDWRWIPKIVQDLQPKKLLGLTASVNTKALNHLQQLFQWQQIFSKSPYKSNIRIEVTKVNDEEEQLSAAEEFWNDWWLSNNSTCVTYITLIKQLEKLRQRLNKEKQWPILTYHGKLGSHRANILKKFIRTPKILLLATPAFGMGIDKTNIHYLLHFNIPAHVEQWLQEIGRSGRDGLPVKAQTLYLDKDILTQMSFIEEIPEENDLIEAFSIILNDPHILQTQNSNSLEKRFEIRLKRQINAPLILSYLADLGLLQWEPKSRHYLVTNVNKTTWIEWIEELNLKEVKKKRYEGLHELVQTLNSKACRWQTICRYFGYEMPPCGHCDNCS